ncbi:hypothetical protein Pla8534_28840 [Lignipirellula cremea]|uniref:Uncharacterized protein n=1 Tax=Lignipirellula cremea TaxID=2528010 RepID=A0A518DTA2_9BACT|nr:hypothetical protein Pla8534_28840 [Lignipirellula cremea]
MTQPSKKQAKIRLRIRRHDSYSPKHRRAAKKGASQILAHQSPLIVKVWVAPLSRPIGGAVAKKYAPILGDILVYDEARSNGHTHAEACSMAVIEEVNPLPIGYSELEVAKKGATQIFAHQSPLVVKDWVAHLSK